MIYLLTFIFGAVVGSFLNVCIYRIPKKISIITPFSHCPSCGKPVKFYDNIPIISYILLRGRCRSCRVNIPIRYLLVESLNAVLYIIALERFGPSASLLVYFVFLSSLIVISFIDLEYQIIPDRITLPGIPIALILGSTVLPDPFWRFSQLGFKASIIGFLLGGGIFYLIALLSKGGMGGGDIKLMAMIGGLLGWKGVFATTFFGSLSGSLVGIFLMIFKGKGRKTKIPFGPFLAFGAIISLFWGQEILMWYLYAR